MEKIEIEDYEYSVFMAMKRAYDREVGHETEISDYIGFLLCKDIKDTYHKNDLWEDVVLEFVENRYLFNLARKVEQ